MAETNMEHKGPLEKLLSGHAQGIGVALRGCPEEVADEVMERFAGAPVGRIRLMEPCRVEHPHSAFLRKNLVSHGRQAVQTTLFAPGGKLTSEQSPDGEVFERFVKRPQDFEVLRSYLRDVELHPAKAQPGADAVTAACLGLTPLREMETRWAGPELTQWALMTQDESAASCLRKLERQLHRRAEEAVHMLCSVALLADMAAEPLPETYMLHAGRHIEWIRHAGLFPVVEVARPTEPLLAALAAASAGARMALSNPVLHEEGFAPPEGMRFIFDMEAKAGLGGLQLEQVKCLLGKCCSAVVFLDCYQASLDEITASIEVLL